MTHPSFHQITIAPVSLPGVLRRAAGCLLVPLLLLPALAWPEVVMRLEWRLDGPLSDLQAYVREGVALQKRINPEVRHELWVDEIHGQSTPSASLLVYYRDLEHYGQALTREEADDEWNAFIGRFPADSFPNTFAGLSNVVIGDEESVAAGEVMSIFVFEPEDSIDGLAEQVRRAASIHEDLGITSSLRLFTAMIAGPGMGAAVTTRYPSVAAFGRSARALAESDAWQSFLSDFPSDRYPMVYRGLSRSVAVD